MAMMYPYVFVLGDFFEGLKVYNLETGECIRDYHYVDYVDGWISSLHSNGRFLTIGNAFIHWKVITLDIQELIKEEIKDSDLWVMIMEASNPLSQAVSNKTKLFVSNQTSSIEGKLTAYNCWRDKSSEVGNNISYISLLCSLLSTRFWQIYAGLSNWFSTRLF